MELKHKIINKIKTQVQSIDWPFLLFLFLILNVSTFVKVAGLLLLYVLRFNFKFQLNNKRLPLFYVSIIGLAFIQFLFNYSYWSTSYFMLFSACVVFWLAAFLILHQCQLAIERNGVAKIEKILVCFFTINAIVSIGTLVHIMFITKCLNPYQYVGMNMLYHMSTGDHILGVFKDFSATNSIINVFGVIYFLMNRKIWLSVLCLVVVLITTSNLNIIIMTLAILAIFIFYKSRFKKSLMICYLAMIAVFFIKVSPNNFKYIASMFGVKIEVENPVEEPFKLDVNPQDVVKTSSPKSSEDAKIFREIELCRIALEDSEVANEKKQDKTFIQSREHAELKILSFSKKMYHDSLTRSTDLQIKSSPGKLTSVLETIHYLSSNVKHFLLGAGAGRFSSKIAFRASGIGIFGSYPSSLNYVADDFKDNHLKIFTFYFLQPSDKHSVANTPFSVLNQILGEYGVVGMLFFFIFYVYFFLKHYKKLTYGKVLLPVFLIFLLTDYWFEHLSIVIVFEIMMLLDIAQHNKIQSPDDTIAE